MSDTIRQALSATSESPQPEDGIGLCLSGGGYRAMVFHIGVLWRLYETGILGKVARISSVSGGSITAAVLGLQWRNLNFAAPQPQADFVPRVVAPLRRLAGETIDVGSVITGVLLPGRVSDRVAEAYEAHLELKGATLQALPDAPRFVINATNVQSGALWRFSKRYMRDYRVGEIKKPEIPLSVAMAASSAFPPILSPAEITVNPNDFTANSGTDLQHPPYTSKVVLTDGGVYDNLGLETVFKRYRTVLVSDGGGKTQPEASPASNWAGHAYRVLDLIDNQVRSLRKRALIDAYKAPPDQSIHRKGAYWGIRTDIRNYGLNKTLDCPVARTLALAETPTRLEALKAAHQERLINWGYAVCDAALRKHVDPTLTPAVEFPYPAAKV